MRALGYVGILICLLAPCGLPALADGESDWTATRLIEIDRRNFKGKGLIQPTLWESAPGPPG